MYKKILIPLLSFVFYAFSDNVQYLIYKIDVDSQKIEKYEISLQSQIPNIDSIKIFAAKTDPWYHPILFDTIFPGHYYLNYQIPGDYGWVDFISNTNQPQKIVTLHLEAMSGGGIKRCNIMGNKSEVIFSNEKANNKITINNVLKNGIFDIL